MPELPNEIPITEEITCQRCHETMPEDEQYTVYIDSEQEPKTWCNDCYNYHTNTCNACDYTYSMELCKYCDNCDAIYCSTCLTGNDHECVVTCDNCDTRTIDFEEIYSMAGEQPRCSLVCDTCQENLTTVIDETTSELWNIEDCYQLAQDLQDIELRNKKYISAFQKRQRQQSITECIDCSITILRTRMCSFMPLNLGTTIGYVCAKCYISRGINENMDEDDLKNQIKNWFRSHDITFNLLDDYPYNGTRPERHIDPMDKLQKLESKAINTLKRAQQEEITPVHDRTYIGFEIECFGGQFVKATNSKAKNKNILIGPNKALHLMLPEYTRIVPDGSIRGNNPWEFLPPVIKNETDWSKLEQLTESLKDMQWQVNNSCGLHMHFSHNKISIEEPKVARQIFRIFYILEPLIFKCLPANRRNNAYCQPLKTFWSKEEVMRDMKLDYFYYGNFWNKKITRPNDSNGHPSLYDQEGNNIHFGQGCISKQHMDTLKHNDHYFIGRYIGCNLHALFQKGTIELRYFPSSLDFTYIYSWALLMRALINYGINLKPLTDIEQIMAKTTVDGKIKALTKLLELPELYDFLKNEYKNNLVNHEVTTKSTEVNEYIKKKIITFHPITKAPKNFGIKKRKQKEEEARKKQNTPRILTSITQELRDLVAQGCYIIVSYSHNKVSLVSTDTSSQQIYTITAMMAYNLGVINHRIYQELTS